MAQPSPERRFLVSLEPLSPCPVCKSPRFTRAGWVDDVGIYWCADCDGVFTIPRTVTPTTMIARKPRRPPRSDDRLRLAKNAPL
jgi:ribosomal protein L37AE/L43A